MLDDYDQEMAKNVVFYRTRDVTVKKMEQLVKYVNRKFIKYKNFSKKEITLFLLYVTDVMLKEFENEEFFYQFSLSYKELFVFYPKQNQLQIYNYKSGNIFKRDMDLGFKYQKFIEMRLLEGVSIDTNFIQPDNRLLLFTT